MSAARAGMARSVLARRGGVILCTLAMAAAGVAALVWWKTSLITVALVAFGLVCLAAGFYAWMSGRRIGRLLDSRHPAAAGVDDPGIITGTEHDQGVDHVE